MTDINNGIHLIVKANKQALHRERSKSFVILSMIVKAWNSNEAKVQVRISQTQESKHWIQIGHKETHKDSERAGMLTRNMAMEEGNKGVKHTKEL